MSLTAAVHIEELLELDNFAAPEVMSAFTISIMQNMIARKANEDLSTQKLQAVESQLSRITRMRIHCVTARLPELITSSKTLTIVSIPSPGPALVAMFVARLSLPVISSAVVLQVSPNTTLCLKIWFS
jgi:hypothetical protein